MSVRSEKVPISADPVAELWRKHGMSDATFYTWKSKYGGLEVREAKRLPIQIAALQN